MQIALSTQPNLEIRSANVKDIVLSAAGDPLGRRVIGLRISKYSRLSVLSCR